MSTQIVTKLRKLRLGGMVESLQNQLEQVGTYGDLPFTERLDLLLSHELQGRQQRKQQRLIRQANFKLLATVPQIDYRPGRNLNKSKLAELAQCDWLSRAHNVLITGPCGSGKTFIACALGHQACLFGHQVRYVRLSKLLLQLSQSRADGSYLKQLRQWSKVELLIIDDWGMQTLKISERQDLMEIFEDRYQLHATAIISQRPTDQWYDTIGDNTLADAILDRLMHNAHRIELKGESMRVHDQPA